MSWRGAAALALGLASACGAGEVPVYETWPFDAAEAYKRQGETAKALDVAIEKNVEVSRGVQMTLVLLPAGRFMMGDSMAPEEAQRRWPGGRAAWFADAHPRHPVKLTEPFYISKTEVTRGAFAAFVRETNYVTDAEKTNKVYVYQGSTWRVGEGLSWKNPGFEQTDEHPVVCVSWNDAKAFCTWLTRKVHARFLFDLPTEAQWEYACRAGSDSVWPFSSSDREEDAQGKANVASEGDGLAGKCEFLHPFKGVRDGFTFTAPVGKFAANGFGLHDMIGNVWEWCSDRYAARYSEEPEQKDPEGPKEGSENVVRGGSWCGYPWGTRAPSRAGHEPNVACTDGGFRVVSANPWRIRDEFDKLATPEDLDAVKAGLFWLAYAQEKADGSWNATSWDGNYAFQHGMTGLALLAFQGAGRTHKKGEFQEHVRRGLEWLRDHQNPDGSFPCMNFYEHGIAAMALSEAYGMTKDEEFKAAAQRAIDHICNTQPDHGGFRYKGATLREDGDLSITGWQIMAIKSAIMAGLNVPPQAVERSKVLLRSTWRGNGASAYVVRDSGAGSLDMAAVGLACRIFLGEGTEYANEIYQAAQYLLSHRKELSGSAVRPSTKGVIDGTCPFLGDLYYTYYSSLGMFQVDGPDGKSWTTWKGEYHDPLVRAQVQQPTHDDAGRYIKGSWHTAPDISGIVGRVYTTTLALLSLEVPYRFLPIYGGSGKGPAKGVPPGGWK